MKTTICPPARHPQGAQKGIAQSDVRELCLQANPRAGGEPNHREPAPDDSFVDLMTPGEKALLVGVREDGMIAFPEGSTRSAEQTLKRLKHLIQLGLVRYTRKKNWYRAWWITRKGRRLAQAIGLWQRASSASVAGLAQPGRAPFPVTSTL